jgi:hypothetical protein
MYYLPWAGKLYESGYRHGKRLLIMGESHYGDAYKLATRHWTKEHFARNSYRFWTTLERVVEGRELDTSARRRFWERVAFSNIIQEPLGGPGDLPTNAHWLRGRKAFREIIFWTRPDLILVFTKRGFNQIPDRTEFPGSRDVALISPNKQPAYMYFVEPGYKILAGSLNHPRRMVYTRDKWHCWVRRLLAAAPSNRRPKVPSSSRGGPLQTHARGRLQGVRR